MKRRITCLLMGFVALTAGLAGAQAADSPAKQLVQKTMAYASGLDSATVQIDEKVKLTEPGQTQELACKVTVSLKGKDKFFADGQRADSVFTVVSDGKSHNLIQKKEKTYSPLPSMTPRGQLLAAGTGPLEGMGLSFLAKFLHNDASILTDAEFTEAGEEKLSAAGANDPAAKKITMKSKSVTAEFWITPGDAPLLRQYRLDATSALQGAPQGVSLVYEGQLNGWQPNVALEDTLFAFAPPPEFKKVVMEGQPEYIDQPAPAVALDLLDGGKLDLAEFKDKNIVLFDFWATWCGPCRMTLPVINELAKTYSEKGVKVFAINGGEEPAKVKEFATKMGLTLPIALDKEDKVNTAYGVKGIPFMILIDKQGVVRGYHVGASPTIKEDISSELDALLAAPAVAPAAVPVAAAAPAK